MKKVILTPLFLVVCLSAWAWGATGHRATGLVAEKHLTKKARKELQRVLNGQSIAMASTWMDDIRSDSTYDYANDWHWVTILNGQTYEQSDKNPHGDVIQTLERLIKELKTKKLSPKDEQEHVKMLIHLIGDIHQPLHVGIKDQGGNQVKVSWFREDSNLHRVWDSDMIDGTKLSYTELAESLDKPDATRVATLQKASVRDWAKESISYRPQVYAYGNGKLGYKYAYVNMPLVRERLMMAGIRLAGILNEIYK